MCWRDWDSLNEPQKNWIQSNPVIGLKTTEPVSVNGVFKGYNTTARSEDEMLALWKKLAAMYPETIEVTPIEFTTGDQNND